MPLSFSASVLSEASGPVEKSDRVLRRRRVQLGAGRVALLLQAGDEDLAARSIHLPSPSAAARACDVGQHVGDRLHLRDRVVELGHAPRRRVDVRVDQAGQDGLAAEVDHDRCLGPWWRRTSASVPTRDDLRRPSRPSPGATENVRVDGDDLAVVDDQVGVGRRAPRRRMTRRAGRPGAIAARICVSWRCAEERRRSWTDCKADVPARAHCRSRGKHAATMRALPRCLVSSIVVLLVMASRPAHILAEDDPLAWPA